MAYRPARAIFQGQLCGTNAQAIHSVFVCVGKMRADVGKTALAVRWLFDSG
jgi:hypothetical protein